MAHSSPVSWKRLIAEGAAIVASILLAFWIDAMWEERQEDRQLHGTLAAIRSDLEFSKRSVAFSRSVAMARRDALLALYEAANRESPQLEGKALDELLTTLEWAPYGANIGMAGIQALIFSGTLAAIENEALRSEIADWPRRISILQQKEQHDRAGYYEVWLPYARRNGDIGQLENLVSHYPGNPDRAVEAFPIPPHKAFDHSGMLQDREFRNIVVATWVTMIDLIAQYERTETWLDESLALIDAEQDR